MGLPKSGDAASRFSGYVEGLTSVMGHADRAKPLRDYCTGLMMPCERKSVEPMAAVTAPERTSAQHQSLLHSVGEGNWCDKKVLAKVRECSRHPAPDVGMGAWHWAAAGKELVGTWATSKVAAA
jgi:SRSO17 transposase